MCNNPSTRPGHSTYPHRLSFPSSFRPINSSSPSPPMSAPSSRKKSIISSVGPSIDLPVANNTLLNKSASQSTSLYQQCSSLRARLLRIRHFQPYFALASPPGSSRQSTDPVTQLWDCFALGIPLCYLFNLLPPPIIPISINTVADKFDASNERDKKRAIALFSMQIRQLEDCEQFTVTDLYNRDSTDGFVKVCLPALFPLTASHRLLASPRLSIQ